VSKSFRDVSILKATALCVSTKCNQTIGSASNHMTTKQIDMDALLQRDAAAFHDLVEAYSPGIYNLAMKMLGNPDLAEDILQETFVNACRAIDRFEGRSHISTWLYRIAHNAVLMRLRKEKGIPELSSIDDELDVDTLPTPTPWDDSPERRLLRTELLEVMDGALTTLSEALREVFVLRDIDGLSTAETAEVLNISQTAVKSRLHRARLALRELLAPYLIGAELEAES
jgi:RNA polymerase sigma-70 factor (ECF subfamily)